MPAQPNIVWRVVQWIRDWFLSSEEEDSQEDPEDLEQRIIEELEHGVSEEPEHGQEQRFTLYNQIIQRQRNIAQNLQLQAETPEERPNQGEFPIVYTIRVGDIQVPVQGISRSLVLSIEENGVRYRLDIVQVHNDYVAWNVRADWPGQ